MEEHLRRECAQWCFDVLTPETTAADTDAAHRSHRRRRGRRRGRTYGRNHAPAATLARCERCHELAEKWSYYLVRPTLDQHDQLQADAMLRFRLSALRPRQHRPRHRHRHPHPPLSHPSIPAWCTLARWIVATCDDYEPPSISQVAVAAATLAGSVLLLVAAASATLFCLVAWEPRKPPPLPLLSLELCRPRICLTANSSTSPYLAQLSTQSPQYALSWMVPNWHVMSMTGFTTRDYYDVGHSEDFYRTRDQFRSFDESLYEMNQDTHWNITRTLAPVDFRIVRWELTTVHWLSRFLPIRTPQPEVHAELWTTLQPALTELFNAGANVQSSISKLLGVLDDGDARRTSLLHDMQRTIEQETQDDAHNEPHATSALNDYRTNTLLRMKALKYYNDRYRMALIVAAHRTSAAIFATKAIYRAMDYTGLAMSRAQKTFFDSSRRSPPPQDMIDLFTSIQQFTGPPRASIVAFAERASLYAAKHWAQHYTADVKASLAACHDFEGGVDGGQDPKQSDWISQCADMHLSLIMTNPNDRHNLATTETTLPGLLCSILSSIFSPSSTHYTQHTLLTTLISRAYSPWRFFRSAQPDMSRPWEDVFQKLPSYYMLWDGRGSMWYPEGKRKNAGAMWAEAVSRRAEKKGRQSSNDGSVDDDAWKSWKPALNGERCLVLGDWLDDNKGVGRKGNVDEDWMLRSLFYIRDAETAGRVLQRIDHRHHIDRGGEVRGEMFGEEDDSAAVTAAISKAEAVANASEIINQEIWCVDLPWETKDINEKMAEKVDFLRTWTEHVRKRDRQRKETHAAWEDRV